MFQYVVEFDISAEDYTKAYSYSDHREATKAVDTLNERHSGKKIFQLIQCSTKQKEFKRHDGASVRIEDEAKLVLAS